MALNDNSGNAPTVNGTNVTPAAENGGQSQYYTLTNQQQLITQVGNTAGTTFYTFVASIRRNSDSTCTLSVTSSQSGTSNAQSQTRRANVKLSPSLHG